MIYLFLLILTIVCLASFIPICQYLYYEFIKEKFIKKNSKELRYYFSQDLLDRHLEGETVLHPSLMVRVINNREEMTELWEEEMKYNLP